jgi:hypothetical protein
MPSLPLASARSAPMETPARAGAPPARAPLAPSAATCRSAARSLALTAAAAARSACSPSSPWSSRIVTAGLPSAARTRATAVRQPGASWPLACPARPRDAPATRQPRRPCAVYELPLSHTPPKSLFRSRMTGPSVWRGNTQRQCRRWLVLQHPSCTMKVPACQAKHTNVQSGPLTCLRLLCSARLRHWPPGWKGVRVRAGLGLRRARLRYAWQSQVPMLKRMVEKMMTPTPSLQAGSMSGEHTVIRQLPQRLHPVESAEHSSRRGKRTSAPAVTKESNKTIT